MPDHLNKRVNRLEERVGHLERLNAPRQKDPHPIGPSDNPEQHGEAAPGETALPNRSANNRTNSTQERQDDGRPWWIRMWVWRPWKRILTVVVGIAGIAYAVTTYRQWNDANRNFRIDQRPWIRIELAPSESTGQQVNVTTTVGSPLIIPVRIKNVGKTPAENITGTFAIQIAGKSDELFLPPDMNNPPHVEHPTHRVGLTHVDTGSIFPDQFHDWPIAKVDDSRIGASGPVPITQGDLDRLRNGDLIYIEGTVTYWDEFGNKHWTRYCNSIPKTFDSQLACVKYNRADSEY
jgi:hypothetical protein